MKRLIFSLLLVFAAASATVARPNFIFVLIDDMGYGDLSCYGNQRVRTENLDRLAREGIRFTQFYVAAPICSPSRTALLTGQFPARWRITSYLANRKANTERGMAQWLDPAAPTVARALHQAGYATGHFGKWHMGGQRDVGDAPLISDYGFDQSLTQFEGLGDRILPLLVTANGTNRYALGSDTLGRGQITWMDRSKVTGAFVERAIEFIRKQEGKPFYVNVWPDDVHSPFYPPGALRGDGTKKELYLGVTRAMDEQLGPLFDYVRSQPQLRTNTIIIVASDNGPEPGAGSAGSFRGHKGNLYEGGVREPFIIWAPGFMSETARGTVNEQTVIGAVDLFPSLLKLAGLSPEEVSFDGEDMSAAFLGRKQTPRTRRLFWIRPPDRPGEDGDRWPDLSMREENWKLLLMEDGTGAQLYDLAKDPGEKNNLAAQNPKIVERLSRRLLGWRRSLPLLPDQPRVISK
jgi:arylsulfatase A-like enzyme